jgi:hypothetical protein
MAKEYYITIKLRHKHLLYSILYVLHFLPRPFAEWLINETRFVHLFFTVDKG